MQTPTRLEKYKLQAEGLIAAKAVRRIEFSGATYKVKIDDPKTHKDFWVFLQLDPDGQIRDSFCSCEEEGIEGCLHLATAWYKIYGTGKLPLHKRFEHSLWNKLGYLFFEKCNDEAHLKKTGPPEYQCSALKEKISCKIQVKTEEA